jgi:hypothetical protein
MQGETATQMLILLKQRFLKAHWLATSALYTVETVYPARPTVHVLRSGERELFRWVVTLL